MSTNSSFLTMPGRLMIALLAAVMFGAPLCLAGDLPTTDEIIAKMIEAEGGAAAKKKIKNRVVKMTLDLGMAGMTGKGLIRSARPANMHMTMDVQGMGTMEEGVTDGVAWSLAAMTGPQIKEGGERGAALRDADFDGLLEWKRHFKKIECVSKETLDGTECFKLEMTPIDGKLITSYVDAKTYLPHRTDIKLETPMGEFDLKVYSEDYRAVDGVQYSHKSRVEVMGQKRVMTIESIEHNVDMPKGSFELPDEIKALVTKSKEEKSKL